MAQNEYKTITFHILCKLNRESLSPNHGVPKDAGVAKEGQIGHVLGAVELGGVDLAVIQSFEGIWNISIMGLTRRSQPCTSSLPR